MSGKVQQQQGALVVLSGGQDSTTCLAWAKTEFGDNVHAVTFDYGQRHAVEIDAARKVAEILGVKSHEVVDVRGTLKGTSGLVSDNPIGHYAGPDALPGGVEPTFVPARNILFLTVAANRAAVLGVRHVVTGVCEEDYGGYPDCRQVFIDAMSDALRLGIYGEQIVPALIELHTPLMRLSKAASVRMAFDLGNDCVNALAHSHTCYDGCYPPCPNNHASILRAKGFRDAGYPDPLIVRAIGEGLLPIAYPNHGLVEGTEYAGPGKGKIVVSGTRSRRWQVI